MPNETLRDQIIAKGGVDVPEGKTLKPLGDRVLVKMDAVSNKIGNIIMPDSKLPEAQLNERMGTVIAVSDGWHKDYIHYQPMQVKVGDRVMLSDYSGLPQMINGEVHRVCPHVDIFAIEKDITKTEEDE